MLRLNEQELVKVIDMHLLDHMPLIYLLEERKENKDIALIIERIIRYEEKVQQIDNEEQLRFTNHHSSFKLKKESIQLFIEREELLKAHNSLRLEYVDEQLIRSYIPLVSDCIHYFFRDVPLSKQDAVACGLVSLYATIKDYDYHINDNFVIFAIPYILNEIKNYFQEVNGETWNEHFQKEKSSYNIWLNKVLDNQVTFAKEDTERVEEPIMASNVTERQVFTDELRHTIHEDIKQIGKLEAQVLIYRYGLNNEPMMTRKEIAELLHVSNETVRGLEERALRKLRNPKFSKTLREYMNYLDTEDIYPINKRR